MQLGINLSNQYHCLSAHIYGGVFCFFVLFFNIDAFIMLIYRVGEFVCDRGVS